MSESTSRSLSRVIAFTTAPKADKETSCNVAMSLLSSTPMSMPKLSFIFLTEMSPFSDPIIFSIADFTFLSRLSSSMGKLKSEKFMSASLLTSSSVNEFTTMDKSFKISLTGAE